MLSLKAMRPVSSWGSLIFLLPFTTYIFYELLSDTGILIYTYMWKRRFA